MTKAGGHFADGGFTATSNAFLQGIADKVSRLPPDQIASRVRELVRDHDKRRVDECLNMNPAEGMMSPMASALLDSDMATRATEGLPGDKSFPHFGQEYINEIEAIIIALAKEQFGARFVEWRPASSTMANATVFFALTNHDDTLLVQDMDGGGNFVYQPVGPAGLRTANVQFIKPAGDTFEIDTDQVAHAAAILKPKMIVVGGGKILFPYPLRELRRIADDVGAILFFDAAHLGLLVSFGTFQRPLEEGAHVVSVGTAKSFGGPVGALLLTNDPGISAKISSLIFPGLQQTRDQNKFSALAITLAEHLASGKELADRMVANARALAAALDELGFEVLARDRGYTSTHQLFLRLGDNARTFERRCNAANIVVPDCALTGDTPLGRRTGARIATHEVSRLGMGAPEMRTIATLMHRAGSDESQIPLVAREVRSLRARFPRSAVGLRAQGQTLPGTGKGIAR